MKRVFSLSLALILICAGFCVPCRALSPVDVQTGDTVQIWVDIKNGGTAILTPEAGSPAPAQSALVLKNKESRAFQVKITDVGIFRYALSVQPDDRRIIFDDTVYYVEIHAWNEDGKLRSVVVLYDKESGEKVGSIVEDETPEEGTGESTHMLSVSFANSRRNSSGRGNSYDSNRDPSDTPTVDTTGSTTGGDPTSGTGTPTDGSPDGGTGTDTGEPPDGGTGTDTGEPPDGGTDPGRNPDTPDGGTGTGKDPDGGTDTGKNPDHPDGGTDPGRDPDGGTDTGRDPDGGTDPGRDPDGGTDTDRNPDDGTDPGRDPDGGTGTGTGREPKGGTGTGTGREPKGGTGGGSNSGAGNGNAGGSQTGPSARGTTHQPKTGDDSQLTRYLLLAIFASAGLFVESVIYYLSVDAERKRVLMAADRAFRG